MKLRLITHLIMLGLLATLTTCDQPTVEVDFAAPFPVNSSDLPGFEPRHWGRYLATSDTSEALIINRYTLVQQQWYTCPVSIKQLDSLGLPHAGEVLLKNQLYRIKPIATDSFRLSKQYLDTIFEIGNETTHLRRYKGWYYLNSPGSLIPGRWEVQRLGISNAHLTWQIPNPDSLRLQALDTSAVRLRREPQHLMFTLQPPPGYPTRQLNNYAGLWRVQGNYQRYPYSSKAK